MCTCLSPADTLKQLISRPQFWKKLTGTQSLAHCSHEDKRQRGEWDAPSGYPRPPCITEPRHTSSVTPTQSAQLALTETRHSRRHPALLLPPACGMFQVCSCVCMELFNWLVSAQVGRSRTLIDCCTDPLVGDWKVISPRAVLAMTSLRQAEADWTYKR